jgi:hypothetical protein
MREIDERLNRGNWFPDPGPRPRTIPFAIPTKRGTGVAAASYAAKWWPIVQVPLATARSGYKEQLESTDQVLNTIMQSHDCEHRARK